MRKRKKDKEVAVTNITLMSAVAVRRSIAQRFSVASAVNCVGKIIHVVCVVFY